MQVEILGQCLHLLIGLLVEQNGWNHCMISHGCYAIRIIVCNETFLASSA
jgi:hypothetical protein